MSFTMEKDGHEIEMTNDRDWGLEILGVKCPYKDKLKAIREYFEERERGDIEIYWVWKDLKRVLENSQFTTDYDKEEG